MAHELVTRKFSLPKQSTVDSLTELFRAAVAQKGSVQKVVFSVDPLELSVDVFVPVGTVLEGDPPTGDPENVWQVLSLVQMEEVGLESSKLNLNAVSLLTTLMVKAASKKMAGVAWATGSVKGFLKWVGVRVKDDPPAAFWNLPLLELDELPAETLVLLCAKSSRLGVLRAELGLLTHMKEAEDVGPRE